MTCIYAKSVGNKIACHCSDIAGGQRYTFVPASRCQTCPYSTDTDPETHQPAIPSGCVYLGLPTTSAPCSGCGGKKTVDVYQCEVFGEVLRTTADKGRLLVPESVDDADRERQTKLARSTACDRCKSRTTFASAVCEAWQQRQELFAKHGHHWLCFSGDAVITGPYADNVGFVFPRDKPFDVITETLDQWDGPMSPIIYRRSALAATGAMELDPAEGAAIDWVLMQHLLRAGWIGVRA